MSPDARGAHQTRRVVATAGHVDHGKSSLVEALTGTQPDRLPEERRRGMTIDLGFAWCDLPSGSGIAFVDVPGHERFVRTMLAGVGPVRLVLFVVAADEGWSAQSEEHLAIVDVLGVDGAVVALTKRDLIDDATAGSRASEVRARLAGSALAHAPIVAVSAMTGAGLDDLRHALDEMVTGAPEPPAGRARLAIDRAFTVRGAGTVVTGTLTGAPIAVGDDLEILPSDRLVRVRGLQSHGADVEVARPGSRVAVNVVGAARDEVARGDALGRPGERRPTDVIEVHLRPIRGRTAPADRGAYVLHAAAAERPARLRMLGASGDDATVEATTGRVGTFARIRLASPLALDVGDRFVLRDAGRDTTVAGGVILDVAPPARPGPDAVERLRARGLAAREELPRLLVAERGALPRAEVLPLVGASPSAIPGARAIAGADGWWVVDGILDRAASAAVEVLGRFHVQHPESPGAPMLPVRDAISAVLGRRIATAELIGAVMEDLVSSGMIVREGTMVRLPTHRPDADDLGSAVRRVVGLVARGEPTPPTIETIVASGVRRDTLDAAIRERHLVRIAPDIVVTTSFVERAFQAIADAGDSGLTVSALREILGTSRRYAVPLVEHLDATGRTRRVGDVRVARRRAD